MVNVNHSRNLKRFQEANGRSTGSIPYWTPELIKAAVLEFYEKNGSKPFFLKALSQPGYSSVYAWLYQKYPRHPLEFFYEHGLSHIIKHHIPALKWTDDKLIEVVKEAYKKNGNKPVNDRWMKLNGFAQPLKRIKKQYNSLWNFAKQNNLEDYVVVKRTTAYSVVELIQVFTEAYEKNQKKPLNKQWLEKNGYQKYVSYIKRRYDSIKDFFEEHGLSYMFTVKGNGGVSNRWTEERIIQVIKDAYQENHGNKVSYSYFKEKGYHSMFVVISRRYGSVKGFVQKFNLSEYILTK